MLQWTWICEQYETENGNFEDTEAMTGFRNGEQTGEVE